MSVLREITLGELLERRAQWVELLDRAVYATPFMTPAWILRWYNLHQERVAPLVLVLENKRGVLSGIAPLGVTKGPVRTVCFAGTPYSSTEDILVEPEAAEPFAREAIAHLLASATRWDVLRTRRLPAHSEFLKQLREARSRFASVEEVTCLQPVLTLPATREAYEAQFPKRRRTRQRARWKALAERGVRPRLISDPVEGGKVVAQLLQLRRNSRANLRLRFRERANDRRLERLVCGAVEELLPDRARLWVLERAPEDRIAIALELIQGELGFGFLLGADNAHRDLSPARQIMRHTILAAIDEQRRELDLGPGRDPLKYQYGGRDRCLMRLVAHSPTLRGHLLKHVTRLDLALRASKAATLVRAKLGFIPERADHPMPAAQPTDAVGQRRP